MERAHITLQKKLVGRIIWCKKNLSVKLEARSWRNNENKDINPYFRSFVFKPTCTLKSSQSFKRQ